MLKSSLPKGATLKMFIEQLQGYSLMVYEGA